VRFWDRHPKLLRLFVSLVFASCIVAIGYAVSISVTGKARYGLPTTIEEIDPVVSATQVPAQTRVFVDLQAGYQGVLVVDGLELPTVNRNEVEAAVQPGKQVVLPATTIYEPGNATLTFTPQAGAQISKFSQGVHSVTVIYWKTVEGRSHARSYSWTFNVF
jgi:hypothetical protein